MHQTLYNITLFFFFTDEGGDIYGHHVSFLKEGNNEDSLDEKQQRVPLRIL